MQQVTLRPGDYVAISGMNERYFMIVRAFINAGAKPYKDSDKRAEWLFLVWDDEGDLIGSDGCGSCKRLLSTREVLNATNAGNKDTNMHITDKLCKASKERDEAQARYEQALAEHRKTYPWLAIEERAEPASGVTERLQQMIAENCRKMYATDDMSDPANWRAGDWLICEREARDLTGNKIYKVLRMDGDNDPVIDDDADKSVARPAYHFRFYARPIASAY